MAGQTYPEPSPYDRLILDQRVRFVGDAVAIVAGENRRGGGPGAEAASGCATRCSSRYWTPTRPRTTRSSSTLRTAGVPCARWGRTTGATCAPARPAGDGDVDQVLADCDDVVERTYHTKACQQAMMETFRTYTEMDPYGRLHIVSSTQIVFHVRRILANALDIPKSKIHVEKPRIGGGFGAKQTVVAEVYPALVTWKTGKAGQDDLFPARKARLPARPATRWRSMCAVGAT